jgi:hypothetical protein
VCVFAYVGARNWQPLTNLRILEVVGIDAGESVAEEAENVA